MKTASAPRRRRFVIPIVIAAVVLVLALAFWSPLVGWFTGQSGGAPAGAGVSEAAGPFQLTARVDPDPPAERGNTLWLAVKDSSGKSVSDARVQVEYRMPPMGGMSEMKGSAEVSPRNGQYAARYDLPMSGGWTLHVTVDAGGNHGEAEYGITVGSSGLVAKGGTRARGETAAQGEMAGMSGMGAPDGGAQAGAPPPGSRGSPESGAVTVNERQRSDLGLRTAPVEVAPLKLTTRALGQVKVDETKLVDVTLRVKGWIHDLEVDATGQPVRKGQVLFTLYSPDVYAAEQEYLLALHTRTAGVAGELVAAAKQKLKLWGLTGAQIDEVAKRGAPIENLPFLSPASGVVLEKDAVEGAAVEAGQKLYRIAPLDKVWIEAQVYEGDLPFVRVGEPAQVQLSYVPGKTFEGKVAFVYPTLQGATRTGTVRIELENPGLVLKPDMFADVQLQHEGGARLQVPADAVLYTGPRRIVFVDEGNGRLVPREVTLGARAGDRYEVLSGLRAGERVVTRGNFLIAAESRLQATAFWAERTDASGSQEAR